MVDMVHLHVHSDFSLLDGLAKVKDLAQAAANMGMPALALTDHGAMFGALHFYHAAKDVGVKPIIGCEIYIAPRRMVDKDPKLDTRPYHLILLAENQAGYHNLMQIATAAQLDGFYYKPRVDKEYLAAHAEGLIALSSCGSGEVPRLLQENRPKRARAAAEWYRQVFGPRSFFLELQDHDIPEMEPVNRALVAMSRETGIPLVATNDVHYVRRDQAYAHEILLCIGTGKTITDPSRMRMNNDSYYLRSFDEMAALFPESPEALRNTVAIAERCDLNLDQAGFHLPPFDIPAGYTAETYLRHLTEDGLRRLYGDDFAGDQIQSRLSYEMDIIHRMGFDTYFLLVWDLCEFARRRDIWWNVRGSAAGSIVAYGLGITNLDPLAHELIFERFLNPGRVTMPDIDLDYPDDRRDEMIQYTLHKYGADKVAQIITFGTLGAKAAIRDVGRALDIPLGEVDQVARLVPGGPGVKLDDALEHVPDLRQMYEGVDYVRTLVDAAREVEGVSRHASTHAAGVVVADKPLVEYTPLHRPTRGAAEGLPVVQYTMDVLEDTGLLKIDFLGLSTLTILRKAADLINDRHGICYTQQNIPLDDPKIYQLLSNGDVIGLFQVESAGMRRVLTSMKPAKFEHVVAAIALYRPGPMEFIDDYIASMHGQKQIAYAHPAMEPILGETFGICVYQEQIIRILTDLAGYSPGDADLVRKAVGKKKKEELISHRASFVKGARRHSGLDEGAANKIFDAFEYFARYGFNKAHSSDYAVITCQTAYLKAYYPVEYMAALLTVERSNTDKVGLLIAEAHRQGIPILPPDVNYSGTDFTIEDKTDGVSESAIRFGLAAIKNVGQAAVEVILAARDKGGPFKDVDDFCQRVDLRQVNRRALECLVKAGALSAFGNRAQLLAAVDLMISDSQKFHSGIQQASFFDTPAFAATSIQANLPQIPQASQKEILAWEKDLVGTYISEHPLSRMWVDIEKAITVLTGQIDETMAEQRVTLAGVVNFVRPITTKKGEPMAFAQIEDLQGAIEVVIFPRVWEQTKDLWEPDRILLVRGKVSLRGREPSVLVESVTNEITSAVPKSADEELAPLEGKGGVKSPLHLYITIPRSDDLQSVIKRLGQVYDLLQSHPGDDRFSLYVENGGRGRVQIDFPNDTTRHSLGLEQELRSLLGAGTIRVEPEG
ncbi:MAG: DNA polymerase III subunit alpha [Anaerolineae bacterium]|nr:DNA polymerase III subunit alpha [Anaerolineae bacterium]